MKRVISFVTLLALLAALFVPVGPLGAPAAARAFAGADPVTTPIAIKVDMFDETNTSGDGINTLLWVKGSARSSAGAIELTYGSSQAGSVVKRNQVRLADGFSTYFEMAFNGAADGIVFIIYKADEPKLGDFAGSLGYGDESPDDGTDKAIHDSIAVEFDTWNNYEYDYSSANTLWDSHVGIMFDGNQKHSTQTDSGTAISLSAGLIDNTIKAWVDYDASSSLITVKFNESDSDGEAITVTRSALAYSDAPQSGDDVFIGFTSSTGDNPTSHKLLKWYFSDSYVEDWIQPTPIPRRQLRSTWSFPGLEWK